MILTRIRIPSSFTISNQPTRFETADFRLGLGPCGKEVVELACEPSTPDGFVVTQRTADGETKAFIYPVFQLTGRVEMTYAKEPYLGDDIPGDPSPPLDPNAGVPSGY
jgi:hypothetical protein